MTIAQNPIKLIATLVIAMLPFFALAFDGDQHGDDKEFNASELINGHIGDSHEFHVADWNGHPISFYLPVILWSDNGLTIFSSSKFHHDNSGEHVVEANGQEFVRHNERIYYKDKFETMSLEQKEAMVPVDLSVRPLDFSITKLVFSMLISVILLFILFSAVARSYKKNDKAPKGLAGFLEPLVLFVRDDIAIPNIGEKKYAKYMPYLLTIFFFIWINNIFGLIPFFPFSSNLTGNIFFTFVLSFITFLITTFSGNKDYWKHILTPPVPKALYPIMVPIEIIGIITKPFALMIRLFANITAGHIIILSLISLIFIFKSIFIAPVSGAFVLFMSVLEMLVAALQAYVFTLLSALFIGQAVAEHDHH
ncbi:F0F1 ATP synthase subunit A [Lacinutrix sp. Bg11-31]|uniref:F0F1 ATP synthase subunit A n=1 Tax=Lacinutrix sp. Bg11-31 TaxID=2057808 RepID=UPI000C30B51D|nr:F0F1 ATP synthase subunit A [Lacinutrix sp. Bg11-31]AUC82921.1 ATP synthase F0 subunit A [Lacinutrix sp. Bg11-31]